MTDKQRELLRTRKSLMSNLNIVKQEIAEELAQIANWEKQIKALDTLLKAEGSFEKVKVGNYHIEMKEYSTKRFDSTKFKAENPDTYQDYVKETKSTRLFVKEIVEQEEEL